ncbi:Na+/H+ antiporter NhaC [Vibrio sp. B1FLJ16]|uniref:Na+/H+ antiporter NhaC n=1 Tax=Vibrio sp. B1FLJ16 TaxID=2751178 RepID=UPI0015F747BB|nr:Na+/H+ antiporter NhaC [Vibrio sp. B1FLJ16]CAD7802428.1 Na+/H+ antiporter family [Vibrio sp. B1FLJ16]CAE6893453.1 Na+/H+ antiporter family [Vibrio sp. B1FLJ16]
MNNNTPKIPFTMAILPIILMVGAMLITIVKFEGSPHMPLVFGTMTAALVAWMHGCKWQHIEESIYSGIKLALPAVVIILLVGIAIGAWVGGGVVASMIYYGLQILSPSLFLVSITLICAVVSIAIGSSWSTMGTIGVAGMGIGISMGIPAPMVAGAVISGAYFGDKMSPLSDTTNLAAGLTGTDIFEHIKHMLYTTVPGLLIALTVYWYLGQSFSADDAKFEQISTTMAILQDNFVISPWLLLIPVFVIFLVTRKVPALPALFSGILLGFLSQIFIQGSSVADAVTALQTGYSIETGNEMVDGLFNRGGLESMMYTVSMTIVAMTLGGILENTGMLKSIVEKVLSSSKSARSLIPTTISSCFLTNASCSEQYISVVVPARMFANTYKEKGLHSKNLSRALEDGGTLTSVFIPWNTCGVFILATLGVSAVEYAPYAILNFAVPMISILFALIGFSIVKLQNTNDEAQSGSEVLNGTDPQRQQANL